jgi:O-antigen ligase
LKRFSRYQQHATVLMAVALALAPAYVIRFHFGPLPTTLLELVLGPAIVVGLATFWHELPWQSAYTWPAALLLVAATLDSVFAPDRRAAFGLWKAYFVEPVVAGLVIVAMARSRPRARWLLGGVAIAAVVAASANAYTDGHAILAHTFNKVTPQVAIYNSANDIPLFLEPPACFALAIALHGEDRLERLVAAAVYALAGVAIALSYSRLGWITLVAVTVFVAAFSRWRVLVLAGTALVAAAAFALSHTVRDRILVEFDPHSDKNTLLLRVPLWRSALSMLSHKPIFGGGLGGFKASILPYRDPGYHEDLIYPHNLALNFWSETGILGLAAFAWLAVQVFRVGRRLLTAGPWPRVLGIGLLAMLLSVLLHGIGDVPYFKNDQALVFWGLLAVPLGAGGDNSSAR